MLEKNYLGNDKSFAYAKGYIYLPIEIASLPEHIKVEGEDLIRKTSFHVSLLCVKDIVEKYGDLESKVLDAFCSFIKDTQISFTKYSGEFRLAESEDKKSVIALCEVENLAIFSSSLEELGIQVSSQPTHVTLFTLQPDMGIGLNSAEEMEKKSIEIEVPSEVRLALGLI